MIPEILLLERSMKVRFLSSHSIDEIVPVMFFPPRCSSVTTLSSMHQTPGQVHSEEFEFHDWKNSESLQCCFMFSNMDRSVPENCKVSWKDRLIRKKICILSQKSLELAWIMLI